jgi:hypothetical protein
MLACLCVNINRRKKNTSNKICLVWLDILKFIEYADCYLNVSIVYRVLPAVHVTVTSAEKNSKLKLIKIYLKD